MSGIILPEYADPPRHYMMVIPLAHRDWITDNDRLNWRVKAGRVKQWRSVAKTLAPLCFPKPFPHGAHVVGELRFKDRRRRDPNNWNPTIKACIDGLVDAGVFPDDSAAFVEGPDMRLGPPVAASDCPRLRIHVWPKSA